MVQAIKQADESEQGQVVIPSTWKQGDPAVPATKEGRDQLYQQLDEDWCQYHDAHGHLRSQEEN